MSNQYARYSTKDFDQFDCLKLSKLFYVLVLFMLRGYVVWIMSVTNMRDSVGVIQWFYPEPSLFYLSLLSGIGGLFTILIMSLRRPNAADWVKHCWSYIREIILASLAFDFLINIFGYFYWELQSITLLVSNLFLIISASYFLYSNNRIKINRKEFPEPLPEK